MPPLIEPDRAIKSGTINDDSSSPYIKDDVRVTEASDALSSPRQEPRSHDRRPPLQPNFSSARGSHFTLDVQEKMKAFHLSRRGAPSNVASPQDAVSQSTSMKPGTSAASSSSMDNLMPRNSALPNQVSRYPPGFRPNSRSMATISGHTSAPKGLNPIQGLAAKRGMGMGMKLSDVTGPPLIGSTSSATAKKGTTASSNAVSGSLFSQYTEYVDTATGVLTFKGKATVHGNGVDFCEGTSFKLSLNEIETLDELGKGNYGTVFKVRRSRPHARKIGHGLNGNKISSINNMIRSDEEPNLEDDHVMAMKEIRLELDESKFAAIIMELDVLHRCVSPYIIDFYGAFFQEGAVYICMEFMNGGSVDKLYAGGIPEQPLRRITLATVRGLNALKEEHKIIHRDVKPTNILVNSRGAVKICDFGVSGNLVASIAKTNIGCQSYMAPERISSSNITMDATNPLKGTYSVQSDIWSLGLTIIECALGQYPYPPETYDNIFSQLSAIVDGEPPDLPAENFSPEARDFARGALNKIPNLRPTYKMLMAHPWLSDLSEGVETVSPKSDSKDDYIIDEEVAAWVKTALEMRRNSSHRASAKPALHAVSLEEVLAP